VQLPAPPASSSVQSPSFERVRFPSSPTILITSPGHPDVQSPVTNDLMDRSTVLSQADCVAQSHEVRSPPSGRIGTTASTVECDHDYVNTTRGGFPSSMPPAPAWSTPSSPSSFMQQVSSLIPLASCHPPLRHHRWRNLDVVTVPR
jgi:hypothetical protein